MRALILCATALAVTLGCTPAVDVARGRQAAGARDLDAAIAGLRAALAEDPHDVAAHLGLGLVMAEKGAPGAALRHLEVAYKNGRLFGPDRALLAGLYLRRARARHGLGDGGAYRDLERAAALGENPDDALREKLYLAAALAELRGGTELARARARRLLGRAGPAGEAKIEALNDPRTPGNGRRNDPRTAGNDPRRASAGRLGAVGRWAWEGGAKRVAHTLLERAIYRGGRAPATVAAYIAAETWWHGRDAVLVVKRPSDDELERFEVTADPQRVAQVIEHALATWLRGEAPWLAVVARRVDIPAMLAAARAPAAVEATLWRATGDSRAARAALLRAIEAAPTLTAEQRTIVIAEAAVQGLPAARIEHLFATGPVLPAAHFAAARAARARGDVIAEARILANAPAGVRHNYLRSGLDLGALVSLSPDESAAIAEQYIRRWQRAAAPVPPGASAIQTRWQMLAGGERAPVANGLFQVRLGWPSPARISTRYAQPAQAPDLARALARIRDAYARDPARADRLAREYVDGRVAIGERGPQVAALFGAIGDPARERAWWERILAHSPEHPPYLEHTALAMAHANDPDAALTLLTRAAALSGDAGATWLRGARGFITRRQAMAGLTAARRAMQLAPAGSREPALETLAQAALATGRKIDAARALQALIEEAGPKRAASARSYVLQKYPRVVSVTDEPVRWTRRDRALWRWRMGEDVRDAITELAAADPTDPTLAIAQAEILAHAGRITEANRALDIARAWNPRHVAVRTKRLATTAAENPAFATTLAELLLIGVADPDPKNATAAMVAAAHAFDTLGQTKRAHLARQTAQALRRAQ